MIILVRVDELLPDSVKNVKLSCDCNGLYLYFYLYFSFSKYFQDAVLLVLATRHQRPLEPRHVLLLTTTGNRFQDVVLPVVLATRHQRLLEPGRVFLLTTTGNRYQDAVLLVLATRHQRPLAPRRVLLLITTGNRFQKDVGRNARMVATSRKVLGGPGPAAHATEKS